jgi:putative transposase
MLENHLDICRLLVNEILEEEVIALSGKRYAHDKPHNRRYARYDHNPGSVSIGEHRLNVSVPRVLDQETMKTLDSYARLQDITLDEEYLLRGIMLGLFECCAQVRDFAELNSNPNAQALKKSSIDAVFMEYTDERLRQFEARHFDNERFVGLFVDGRYLAGEQMAIALGVTEQGFKRPLGFIQTSSENSTSISQLFRGL